MKDWCKYKSLEAETQREMRRAHQAYIQDTVNQDLTSTSKRFYSYVKSKKQETTGISPLLNQDGFLHSCSTSKAEILNHQFQSVYTKENLTNIPDIGQSKIPSMKPIIISTPGVIKLLKHLKPHKASGPDNIPTRLLIMVAEEIAPMLTTIFQTSLDTATVPSYWREALITPLYKKGPRNILANYRPVSLTSVVRKMLEHIQLPQDSHPKSTWFSLKTFLRDAADCHNTGNSQKSEKRKGSCGRYYFRLC